MIPRDANLIDVLPQDIKLVDALSKDVKLVDVLSDDTELTDVFHSSANGEFSALGDSPILKSFRVEG